MVPSRPGSRREEDVRRAIGPFFPNRSREAGIAAVLLADIYTGGFGELLDDRADQILLPR